MSVVSKFWANKLPEARVDLDPEVENEVDFVVVWQYLVDQDRIWDGEGEVVRYISDASDNKKADVVKVRDRGWFALTREQARDLDAAIFGEE